MKLFKCVSSTFLLVISGNISKAEGVRETPAYKEIVASLKSFDLLPLPKAFAVEKKVALEQVRKYREQLISDAVKLNLMSEEAIRAQIDAIEPINYFKSRIGWSFKNWSRFNYFTAYDTRTLSQPDTVRGFVVVNGFKLSLVGDQLRILPAIAVGEDRVVYPVSDEAVAAVSASSISQKLLAAFNHKTTKELTGDLSDALHYEFSGNNSVFVWHEGLEWTELNLACVINAECRSLPAL